MSTEQEYSTTVQEAVTYLKTVVEPFCRFPQNLEIEPLHTIGKLTLNIKCYETDYNLVIGKDGVNAFFYRSVMHWWGRRRGGISIEVQVNSTPYKPPRWVRFQKKGQEAAQTP